VTELRFHRDLYDGEAVDEAIKTFDRYAKIERSQEDTHWVVRLSCELPAREQRVAGELGNFALGLTIRRSKSAK
jgi:hypothetical protein